MDRGSYVLKSDLSLSTQTRVGIPSKTKWISFSKRSTTSNESGNIRFNILMDPKKEIWASKQGQYFRASSLFVSQDPTPVNKRAQAQGELKTSSLVFIPTNHRKNSGADLSILKIISSKNEFTENQQMFEMDQSPIPRSHSLAVIADFEEGRSSACQEARSEFEDSLLEFCKEWSPKHKNKRPGSKYDFSEAEYQAFIAKHASQLAKAACVSGSNSKKIQSFVERLEEPKLSQHIPQFLQHLGTLMTNQYGNFIPRALIPKSEKFRSECSLFCLGNFFELTKNRYSVSVMRRLASHSPEFCKVAFEIFRVHLDHLIDQNQDAVLLLSTLVENISDSSKLQKIADVVMNQIQRLQHSPLVRILSAIIDNANGEIVEKLKAFLLHYTNEYIDDKIGNYVIQAFLRKNDCTAKKAVLDCMIDAPMLLFSNKYRRHVLIELLRNNHNTAEDRTHAQELALSIVSSPDYLFNVLNRRYSMYLLLALVLRSQSESTVFDKLTTTSHEPNVNSSQKNLALSRYYREFLDSISCSCSGDFSKLVPMILRTEKDKFYSGGDKKG